MDGIVGHKKLNVKGNYSLCRFYLINPERNASVNSNVRKLLGVKEVDEVYVTEGPHGLIARAPLALQLEAEETTSSIVRQFNGKVGVITSYARYRK
jgi:DNA-binding Lrp family transcriptional regulator